MHPIHKPAPKSLHTMSREQALAIVTRALDWLDANPDKHITGAYAVTGIVTRAEYDGPDDVTKLTWADTYILGAPPRSEEATCFCYVGRIVRETHDEGFDTTAASSHVIESVLTALTPEQDRARAREASAEARTLLVEANDASERPTALTPVLATDESRARLRIMQDRFIKEGKV